MVQAGLVSGEESDESEDESETETDEEEGLKTSANKISGWGI